MPRGVEEPFETAPNGSKQNRQNSARGAAMHWTLGKSTGSFGKGAQHVAVSAGPQQTPKYWSILVLIMATPKKIPLILDTLHVRPNSSMLGVKTEE